MLHNQRKSDARMISVHTTGHVLLCISKDEAMLV